MERRSPLAQIVGSDPAMELMLRDADISLVFTFVDYPRLSVGTPPEQFLPHVGGETLQRMRSGRGYLLIDHSGEGHAHDPRFSELLHAWCTLREVPPSALVYVNANQAWPDRYRDWCAAQEHEQQVVHLYFNAWIHNTAVLSASVDPEQARPPLLHGGPRPFRFLSFNHAARPTRLIVVADLLSTSPPDALVSLGGDKGVSNIDEALKRATTRFKRGRLFERHAALFEDLDHGDLQSRATLGTPISIGRMELHNQLDLEHYSNTYISVVTETEMSRGEVRRVTEKVLKPFLFGHLAIVAGNPGSLAIARELGFQTFEPLIDERYDEILDPADRLCAVLCEINRIRGLDPPRLLDLFMATHDIRRANLRYGRDVLPHRLKVDARQALERFVLDRSSVSV
jgi:hypothetical protein